jgi:hypothetical protein
VHPGPRDAPPACRRLLHEAETIEYIKLIKSSYSIVFNKLSSMGRRDPSQQTGGIMQPSTLSLTQSVSPSPQQAAPAVNATSSFRTVAFALLVDRALAA